MAEDGGGGLAVDGHSSGLLVLVRTPGPRFALRILGAFTPWQSMEAPEAPVILGWPRVSPAAKRPQDRETVRLKVIHIR